MPTLRNVAAAMVLSTLAATPAFAQAAIQEPGMFSFYYPNLDVLIGGAPTPAARLALEPPAVMRAHAPRESGLGRLYARRGGYRSRSPTFLWR
jgi:hypothetical protein